MSVVASLESAPSGGLFPRQLATSRLSLSPPAAADRDTIFRNWASDPLVTRYVAWPTARSPEDLDVFLARSDRGWATGTEHTWLVTETFSAEKIGAISLRVEGHKAQFGYVLRAASWGRGYATELIRELIPLCFSLPAIFRVSAFCDVENLASARVMEKAGLQREGLLRAFARHPQVSQYPRDCWSYSISRHA